MPTNPTNPTGQATEQPAPETARLHCACCEYTQLASASDTASPYEEAGYLLARAGAVQSVVKSAGEAVPDYRVCSFCKLLFPALIPTVPDLSEIELMGA